MILRVVPYTTIADTRGDETRHPHADTFILTYTD